MDYKVKDCVLQSIYSDAYEIANAEIPWDKLVGSTVLITGGGGFIGGYLALALLTRNDVYGSDIRVISLVRNAERAEKKFGKLLFLSIKSRHSLSERRLGLVLKLKLNVKDILHLISEYSHDPVISLSHKPIQISHSSF